ncbi:SgcJ/EcaC family oxidoreductase [Hymenobacter armeniacus]|uniref:SgcJ/EcaC family oxidoreductase n=1 Tax=Hymenobacter armeniacus TaxID=2771358 RepID=A0ABR8JYR8_9BACT|nr:SgcJ/EcaC family oxidoreductase [Hymenobacter armeniacus]MBD2724008.1 SgcJ/EcaC family oxidoreductase [Hymenobacter armeniacus]
MKTFFLSLALCLGTAAAFAQQLPAADEAAIRQVLRRVDANYTDHKFADMAAYTTPDVSWVNIVGMWWQGRPQVQLAHQQIFDSIFKSVPFKQGKVAMRAITPEVALVNVYYEVGAFYPPDGVNRGTNKMGDDQNLLSLIMVKKQGKWLLTAGHNTVVDARAAANDPALAAKK